jgi:hypothetical protein
VTKGSVLLLAALEDEGVARSFRNELALLWPLLADLMLALSHVCSAGAGLMRASSGPAPRSEHELNSWPAACFFDGLLAQSQEGESAFAGRVN